mgnify:CR=1 FL=1
MSLNDEQRLDMVNKYIDMSDMMWDEAEAAYSLQKWSMTANRMYYAVLNAFRGLLLLDGHPTHSHDGVKRLVGQYYVLTEKISDSEGKLYSQLENMRNRADYDCFFRVSENDVVEKFEKSKQLINKIKKLISNGI